jgi:hypothetical protein
LILQSRGGRQLYLAVFMLAQHQRRQNPLIPDFLDRNVTHIAGPDHRPSRFPDPGWLAQRDILQMLRVG